MALFISIEVHLVPDQVLDVMPRQYLLTLIETDLGTFIGFVPLIYLSVGKYSLIPVIVFISITTF